MTNTAIMVIIGAVTFVVSVGTSAFIGGMNWGQISRDVDNMKVDLAEIKGMFRLTLKE